MASPPPIPSRPPPNYTPNPNPNPNANQNPNLNPSSLPGSFQNLQISGPVGAPPPPSTATSRPISRPSGAPPPPSAPSHPSFTTNGAPVGPPVRPPGSSSMIRAPSQPVNAYPGRPISAPFIANPNLNPVAQPLQTGPAASQLNPMIGLAAPQPKSVMGPTASQPNSVMGPNASQPNSVMGGPTAPQRNSVTGPTASQPLYSVMGGPTASQPNSVMGGPTASQLNSVTGSTASQRNSVMAPTAPQPNSVMGPTASQPNSVMGPTASQPFPSRPLGSTIQRPMLSPFSGSLRQNPVGPTGSQSFSGPPASQPYPYSGPPAPASQPVRGPTQSFPGQPFMGQPPMGQPPSMGLPPSMGPPSMGPPLGSAAAPFGAHAWQSQQRPGGMPGTIPPVRMGPAAIGQQQMNPQLGAVMGYSPHASSQVGTPSKIDPTQIPRPVPSSSSSLVYFETRQGSLVSPPPPATSDFVVRDTGNCSPRLMRCTLNQVLCNGEILTQSCMPLTLMVQPFALPHPSEEPIQLVDFGEIGPVRCMRCKAYINPFMRFIDQGRRFVCNLCDIEIRGEGKMKAQKMKALDPFSYINAPSKLSYAIKNISGFSNETPRDYVCNLGPDMRRRDADERPELCRGTVEFVATKEFMVREPMPAMYFFLVDVSMNAVGTGAAAAACSAISQAISDIPGGARTMVGIATFDSTIHFYNLKHSQQQPVMLIVPDVEDVYTPLQTDLIVPLGECREALEQLLESIPSMYQSNKIAESAFGAAIKAGFLALKPTGGKLLVFQSVLPSVGIGSLSSREAEGRINVSTADKEPHKLLQPADKTLTTMAMEFAEYQVCVDVFLTTQTYVDIASISVVPRTTGGQIYYYYPFSAVSDPAKLYNDLRWNLSRPQGLEAVMRVRCSQGLQVQEYSGNFCKRVPTDIDLPAIDSDKTIMVTFKHDDKFQDGAECGFQCAILYTTVHGQRRIRVMNLSLPCTTVLGNLFRSADLDSQFSCFLKQAASGIPTTPLTQVREQIVNRCINILGSYRKFCASVSSSGQLILPEALKLLPLYTIALIKSIGLRNDGRLDERSYWASHAASISTSLAVPFVYPRLISIHDLLSAKEDEDSVLPGTLALSSEYLSDEGIFLLENGEDALIYVGGMVNPEILHKLFDVPSLDGVPSQLVLQQFDNDLSKKLNEVVNEIRRQRCSYLRLLLCKKGEPSGMLFNSYMVEDKSPPGSLSYVEFLVHVHRQIQNQTKSN